MNRQQRRQAQREGTRLVKTYPSVAFLARQSAINDMCKGEFDTDFYRALANVAMDYREGKITKERYDKLVYGIAIRKYSDGEIDKMIKGEGSSEEPKGILSI